MTTDCVEHDTSHPASLNISEFWGPKEASPADAEGLAGSKESFTLEPDSGEGGNNLAPHHHEFSLPPVDRGKDAWLFLAACFVVEALVWGKSLCVSLRLFTCLIILETCT